MKRVILILAIFIFNNASGQSSWFWQNPVPQSNYMYNIQALNDNLFFSVGQGGIIQKTTNGGANWSIYPTGITSELRGLYFIDNNTGYVTGASGRIFKTTNSGVNWIEQTSGVTAALNSVYFRNSTTGWISVSNGACLKTTNGGNNWTSITVSTHDFRSVYFFDDNTGYIAGGASGVSAVYKTTNGGNNWTALNTGTSSFFYSLLFLNNNTGWAAGQNQTVVKTTDGGSNWSVQNTGTGAIWLWNVRFINENTGWISGSDNIFKTTNGGTNWNKISVGLPLTGFNFSGMTVTSTPLIFATGTSGMIIKSSNLGDNWSSLLTGTTDNLSGIHFINQATGYICGYYGIIGNSSIHKTTDGGNTWIGQNIPSVQNLYDIKFYDSNLGFAAGRGLKILVTTNGGTNWTLNYSGSTATEEFQAVAFADANTGFAAGGYFNTSYYSRFYKTTNSGTNWFSVNLADTAVTLYSIQFPYTLTGYACGTGGKIIKTVDGGNNWSSLSSGTTADLRCVYFINPLTGWISGVSGLIRKTTDGGNTWSVQTSGTTGGLTSIVFTNENLGYASGNLGVLKTTNGGVNWTNDFIQASIPVNSMHFINVNTGWIAGNSGMIMKTISGVTGVPEISALNHVDFILSQNYPNPFNPSTKIEYYLPLKSFVSIKVFDISGREIKTIVNETKQGGYYSEEFDGTGLSSGVYFYKLTAYADGRINVITRKMLMIK